MEFVETEAKTVEEAIEKACRELSLPEERLDIEVLSDGASGLFGLMGRKKAKVKASLKEIEVEENKEEKLEHARRSLEEILFRFKTEATVDATENDDKILLNINGDGSGLLIGRRGQTLDALQHIIDKIVNRSSENRKRVIIDTEGYRKRRIESLESLALKLGEKVKKLGKPVSITPLNAHDRRIIHMTLQNDAQLVTKSKGDGPLRRMVIFARKNQ